MSDDAKPMEIDPPKAAAEEAQVPAAEPTDSDDELGKEIDLTEENNKGVIKKILVKGEGDKTPKKGADVSVHYVGTLQSNGEKFDSSRDRNEPFTFSLGKGQVIKGWDIGVASMKKGEKALFTLQPEYGYGAGGSPPKIPGGAVLQFEVELLSWKDEVDVTKDGGVLKRMEKEGEGWESPKEDSEVTVSFSIFIGEQAVHSVKDFKFILGAEEVFSGLEKLVEGMKKGERSIAKIQPEYAFGAAGKPDWKIPPSTVISLDVELVEFTKEKSAWEMETAEKFTNCEKTKNEGNELYKQSKFTRAAKKYKKALGFVESDYSMSDEEKAKAKQLKLPCYLNLAACKGKEKAWSEVIENANKALEIDSQNVKGLFRRGNAQLELDEWELARRDLDTALELDPKNAEVKKEKARLNARIAAQNKKDKQRYKNMFARLSKIEEQEQKEQKELNPPAAEKMDVDKKEEEKKEESGAEKKPDVSEEKKEAD